MVKLQARRQQQRSRASALGWIQIAAFFTLSVGVIGGIAWTSSNRTALDEITLCPAEPKSIFVLLVDVTDPLTTPQRQDFLNQLERLRAKIPRYGKLSIYKVGGDPGRLLVPVITRCNPGTAADESELDGNPAKLQRQWETIFKAPLDDAFQSLMKAAPSDTSPILESIQSVALTELQTPIADGKPRTLVVASDLLQNTGTISFYKGLPDPDVLIKGPGFRTTRTNLAGVDSELWMLQRPNATQIQTRPLADLWDRMLTEEGATVKRIYNVSG